MSLIGKLIYNIYYRPRQKKNTLQKFGGRENYEAMLRAEQEMKQYALNELTINSSFNPHGKYRLNFLTGDKYIHQSLFCTYSFFKFLTPEEAALFSVNYYSDGSLSDKTLAILQQRFSQINVIDETKTQQIIKAALPVSSFPWIYKKLAVFPLIKKLVYPNTGQKGVSIFFDSDMLFWKRPDALLNWLFNESDDTHTAFGIHDVQRSYGYSDTQLDNVYSKGLINNINSGMYAMHSELADPSTIEDLINRFETAYGSQYYLEQLITAILLEQSPRLVLGPIEDYIVKPNEAQCANLQGVLHHYVDESKAFYFNEGWRRNLQVRDDR